jgi:hypothetical protein
MAREISKTAMTTITKALTTKSVRWARKNKLCIFSHLLCDRGH